MIDIKHIDQTNNLEKGDGQLIEAIRSFVFGNNDAFAYIYKVTVSQIMAVCRRYAANDDEAKDILQESYIKIYKSITKFDVNSPFESWAKRIAINTAIDHYRRKLKNAFQLNENFDRAEEEEVMVSNDILNYDFEKVMLAIQELPDGYRIILNLFVLENKSHKEIAELLGIAESTSRSQLTKARKTLKAKFDNHA